jgi:hypothetical protein
MTEDWCDVRAAIRQAIAKGLVAFYQKCELVPPHLKIHWLEGLYGIMCRGVLWCKTF